MTPTPNCYKVVARTLHPYGTETRNRSRYWSACGSFTRLCVEYYRHRWAEPRIDGTGLLAFDTLQHARVFAKSQVLSFHKIFEAIGEDPIALPTTGTYSTEPERIAAVWRPHEAPADPNDTFWPRGTLAFRRIKLLRHAPKEATL